ncbi:MAG TPA: metallopeptidase family protein [Candidatus Dormibacteraeota bacterium]|nr:metallopeptidase family protein [Candidatus Dormibacteraeota bacterium]
MNKVSDQDFQQLINQALAELPGEHINSIRNVAILYQAEPTPQQRQKLALRDDQTLLGLYEGVPLPARQGQTKIYPDKITLFKEPLIKAAADLADLQEQIKHTIWHEVAHYYGLDHGRISSLEGH